MLATTCGSRARRVVVVVLISVSTALGLAGPSAAAPAPPQQSGDLLARYQALGRDAEKASEDMHNAQIDFDAKTREKTDAANAAGAAQRTLDGLRDRQDQLQGSVDTLVRASYRGARVNRLYAVLVSDSPQSLLDQMSGLEMVSRQTTTDLRDFKDTKTKAEKAKTDADAAVKAAGTAADNAERTRSDLQAKQSGLQLQIAQVKAVYESLTGNQLTALVGPKFDFDPRLIPKGTAASAVAVQAALTKIGAPYVWGATGPGQFDCSGLMVWAYQQAGKALPRSSEAQRQGGTEVDRKDLQPGDLVIYYPDASHVGMYVGDGYVVHASTFGVPVKVVPVDAAGPYNDARRF